MTAHQNSASAEYRDDAKYRRLLLILLSTATFFEGYVFLLINLVLPLIQILFYCLHSWGGDILLASQLWLHGGAT